MGKLTFSMSMFNSYVSLPEGTVTYVNLFVNSNQYDLWYANNCSIHVFFQQLITGGGPHCRVFMGILSRKYG